MATNEQFNGAWERAQTVRGKDSDHWRRDEEGNLIRYNSYGTKGEFGCEVDHRVPKSRGGSDHGRNLRALHWQANREKSDSY